MAQIRGKFYTLRRTDGRRYKYRAQYHHLALGKLIQKAVLILPNKLTDTVFAKVNIRLGCQIIQNSHSMRAFKFYHNYVKTLCVMKVML